MSKKLVLSKEPIIQNQDFIIYSEVDLTDEAAVILNTLTSKKQELLDFFGFHSFDKITINLFENQENYYDYVKQFYEPAPYSVGCFFDQEIANVCTSKKRENINLFINELAHECVHIFYRKIWKNKYDRFVWFDEGLAQYLSGEKSKLEIDEGYFKKWYLTNIIGNDKEIPDISFLKNHGTKYGEFVDTVTNKYNGYDLSYLMVRYINENLDIHTFINFYSKLKELETHILPDTINYYNNFFEIASLTSDNNYCDNHHVRAK